MSDKAEKALKKISKARTQLLLNRKYTFWATVGMYQKLVEATTINVPGYGGVTNCPTMATDGEHIYYNADFIEGLNNEELMAVLAHEAGHCALGHHLRRQTRDPFGWNIAADFALNPILQKSGLTLPKGCLLDKQFEGMSAEQIYAKIPITKQGQCSACGGTGQQQQGKGKQGKGQQGGQGKDQGGQGQGQPCPKCGGSGKGQGGFDFGGTGSVIDSELTSKQGEDGIKKWEIIVRQAAMAAKGQGTLPGDFEYLVEPIKPKLDLQAMLRHLISTSCEDDYSWARPNRRHIWNDIYLPSLYTESVGEIVVAIDISGSISKEQASKFTGAVNIVLADFQPKRLHFIQCDAAIQSHEIIEKGDLLPEKVKIRGGGGTDMRPIWKFIEEKQIQPVCAIVCSDFCMGKEDFGKEQEFPVLWVTCTPDAKPPWGLCANLE
jgi:predicted metal-dependent peptidase